MVEKWGGRVSAGINFIFVLVTGMVLWFGFGVRMISITH